MRPGYCRAGVQLYGITGSSTAIHERFCSTGSVKEYGSVMTTE
jgi:hypothetical protein